MNQLPAGRYRPEIRARRRISSETQAYLGANGGDNRRLAVDQVGAKGLRALERLGVSVHNGQEVMELARLIKSPDEIRVMRCAIAAYEEALKVMQSALQPGMGEQELWAILHAENIKWGGEWPETRLPASAPRTNPRYQECISRII